MSDDIFYNLFLKFCATKVPYWRCFKQNGRTRSKMTRPKKHTWKYFLDNDRFLPCFWMKIFENILMRKCSKGYDNNLESLLLWKCCQVKMLPSGQPGQIRLFDHFNWPGSSNYDVITNDVITMTSFLVHLLGIWPSLGSFLMDMMAR